MRRYALLGHPVAHSRSPALHDHWFARHGVAATYVAIDVGPDPAADLADILRREGLSGANLTVPLKEAFLDRVDRLTPLARAARSVNTVWWEGDRLCGDTTDAPGFVDALEAVAPLDPDRPALVLGAGGAGRAVAAGLAARGVTRITLFNRTPQRATAALAHLAPAFPATRFAAYPLQSASEHLSGAGVVAVCVSGPGRAAIRALSIDALPADARWCDLNYWDPDPPHRVALGARFDDGRGMLVHQAARAFERWTGIRPDPADLPR